MVLVIFVLPFISAGQTLIPDYSRSNYMEYFGEKPIPLVKALSFLEEIYQVNFIYESNLLTGRKSQPFTNISRNFHTDLQNAIGDNPIQYIKVGTKTFVLFLKKAVLSKNREIKGRITDKEGAAIPAAEIFIEGTPWGAAANENGIYSIKNVPEGKYTLAVKSMGYRTEYMDVIIEANDQLTQNFTLDIDVLNMNEIVTIASRNPMTKIESSVAITTANSSQISERTWRSTADLLKVIPGFYVESSGGEGGNNLFPRGIPQDGSYRYVAMYEDGLPLYEEPELAFANIDILMRLDETISTMEGVRGGTGSIYASNAPGGLINFVSKTGGNELEGLIKFSVANYGLYRLDGNFGGPIGQNWKFNIGGFLRSDQGIRSPEFSANKGGQLKANITRFFNNGFIRLYGKYLNDRNIFYLPVPLQNPEDPQAIPGFNANYGTLTSIHANNMSFPTPDGRHIKRKISDGINPKMLSLSSELSFELGNGWIINNMTRLMKTDIEFNAIFSLDNPFPATVFADSVKGLYTIPGFERWEYRYSDTGEPIPAISKLNGNGLVARNGWWAITKPLKNIINHLQIKKKARNHSISLSGYFSYFSASDFWYWQNVLTEVKDAPRLLDLVALDASGNVISSVTKNGIEQFGTIYVNADNEALVTAVSLVDEWQTTDKLRLDLGVRLEQNNFKGSVENTRSDFTIEDGNSLAERNVKFGDGTFRNYAYNFKEWALSLGANYSFNRRLAIYSRGSRGFRTPDFDQWMFSADKGNSQYVQQLEAGIKLSADNIALFGTVFFSHINNIPFTDEVIKNGQICKRNLFAQSTTIGTELEAIWSLTKNLQLNLIGTLQNPRLCKLHTATIDPTSGEKMVVNLNGKSVRRIPKIIINFRPSYAFSRFKVYGDWQYIGNRYVDDANTAKLPSYSIFNVGMSCKMFKNGIVLSGNVANLTNTIGLTEGNPRIEQEFANRQDRVFMARPVLGRSFILNATYLF